MKWPEDDPVIVALVASNLLGHYCQDWSSALSEARRGLKLSRQMIDDETLQDGIELGERQYYARVHELWDWIGERAFIERLSNGLVRTKRADRKKAFVVKHWSHLREWYPQAPAIEVSDPRCQRAARCSLSRRDCVRRWGFSLVYTSMRQDRRIRRC